MSILGKLFKSDKGYIEELEKENERLKDTVNVAEAAMLCLYNQGNAEYIVKWLETFAHDGWNKGEK